MEVAYAAQLGGISSTIVLIGNSWLSAGGSGVESVIKNLMVMELNLGT